jgi:hypothetical protein
MEPSTSFGAFFYPISFLKIQPNALQGVFNVYFMSLLLFVAISSFFVDIILFWLFPRHFCHPWCFSSVFLSLAKFRSSQTKISHWSKLLLWMFIFKMFDRSMSNLGMSFKNLDQLILLLNSHNGLKAQETLEMLDLLALKITFLMKIKFNSIYYFFKCVFMFNLILYGNIQNFMTINLTFSTWVMHITYTLLDHIQPNLFGKHAFA